MTKRDEKWHIEKAFDLISLIACALNQTKPDPEDIRTLREDIDELYKIASFHQITAVTAWALQTAGIKDERFTRDLALSGWKDMVMENCQKQIEDAFDEAGIWHMLLKGAIVKNYYPEPCLRQMSDVDYLIDPAAENRVDNLMASLGFERKADPDHEFENHGMYVKKPVCCAEIHWKPYGKKTLFQEGYRYYQDVEKHLITDEDNPLGRHFSDEDFYLYIIAHEYKHYNFGGTGLRSLLDTYLYLKKAGRSLDWKYIRQEAGKMKIGEFERKNRKLAAKVFSPGGLESLSTEEREMLLYFITSGTYGVISHVSANWLKNWGKKKYLVYRIFLPLSSVKSQYPFFYRHKILLPVLPFYRILSHRRRFVNEVRVLLGIKKGTP